jgi:single-strand DNA-binding protein
VLRIEIIGNLGSDPEQRFTQDGKAQASIRVAVNSRRLGQDGENVERTDWFRARVMGAKADYVAQFHKGQRVLVIGRLEISEWQTREGETRVSYDVLAGDVVNLSPREDGPSRGNGGDVQSAASAGSQRSSTGSAASSGDRAADQEDLDELPF